MILFTPEAEALRAVFRDAFGWPYVDAHDGWLIFELPPAELAAHPSEVGDTHHQLYFMCDDLATTIDELQAKAIEIRGEPHEESWWCVSPGSEGCAATSAGGSAKISQPSPAST